jgi:ribose transport system substrate-binding protein
MSRDGRLKRWRLAVGSLGAVALTAAAFSMAAVGTSAASAGATTAAAQKCGSDVVYTNNDPHGTLKTLPASVQARYGSWPYPVAPSPWASFKGTKGPWKIGLIMFPIGSPWQADLVTELKKEFAQAKKAGLVKGSLVTYIQPSQATATPEQQISAVQSMVSQGVNGILVLPLDGAALGPAVTAAGKAHVPIVVLDNVIPNSPYAINVWSQNNSPAAAGVAGLVKTGNILVVRGIEGNTVEAAFQNAAVADIAACPGLTVAGTVVGNWTDAQAKAAVLAFLTAHPGLQINGVIQNGIMMAGIVDAFQTAGVPVPPISDGGCQGGDLSWWLSHKSTYKTVGVCFNGFQTAYSELRILFRVLGGKGPKVNDIAILAPVVTNTNLSQYATPNEPLDWNGEPKGPLNAYCSETCLNAYFSHHGTPGGF